MVCFLSFTKNIVCYNVDRAIGKSEVRILIVRAETVNT
jgi:hypothetical protein